MAGEPQVTAQILRELADLAGGFNSYGRRVTQTEQMEAVRLYNDLIAQRDRVAQDNERIALDAKRVENERAAVEVTAATQRSETAARFMALEIEAERVRVEKAKVLVSALEILVDRIDPVLLLPTIERMLSGPDVVTPTLALTERKDP